ncbi:ABC transporter permease subunit [Faecalimicrobium dakarense]|uniref:ABC transporter permease subunit n=1 Tax=Faecalimicrobium dakarense TaxID=1301100 RepID=UPI0004B15FCE|nr:ABC transporter permease subunit [[Clostridium] dakarense]
MTNLIKSDLYRLKKNKTFRKCMFSMIIFIILITSFFSDPRAEIGIITGQVDNRMYGFILSSALVREGPMEILSTALGFTGIICIMLLFIVGELVMERYEFGVLKNTVSYGHNRYKIYISNLLCIFVVIISLSIMTIGISFVIWNVIYGVNRGITSSEFTIILKVIIAILIILCAMASVYTMIHTLARKKTIVLGLSVLFVTFIPMSLVELKISYINSKMPMLMLMDLCSMPFNNGSLVTFLVSSILIILISAILGCIIFNKQDIK